MGIETNEPLTFKEYQQFSRETAIYPEYAKITYPILGMLGEAGEIANKYKKSIRDNTSIDVDSLASEIGDVIWYLANICSDLGLDFGKVAAANLDKLFDRKDRGVLGGSGDNR